MVQALNRVIKLKGQCVRSAQNAIFLRRCLEAYVTPVHIKQRVRRAKPRHPWAIERSFLRDELNKLQDFLHNDIEKYRLALRVIRKELTFFDQLRFCKLLNLSTERLLEKTRKEKDATLSRLRKQQLGEGVLDHSVIINLANVELTDIQKDVLCRGLNFGVPPKTTNLAVEVQAEFELCWQQLLKYRPNSEDELRACRTSMAGLATRYANEKIDWTGYPLRKEHFDAIHQLKKDKDLLITRPDKGNAVVLLQRKDYISKMQSILSQQDKFIRIGPAANNDTTLQQERALQALLLRAVKRKELTREIYEKIRPVGSSRPRMYGLPKIHKTGAPLRPILSMIGAPQHAMAGWLTEVLQPVLEKYSGRTIKDSFHFCSNIEDFLQHHEAAGTFMCSYDVVSLFTNIPLAETINICLDTLYRDEDVSKPDIPEALLHKLLVKATTEVEFSFDDVIYRQIDGVAMGSPLGPVLANIFVGSCEAKIDVAGWPLMYNRFVDDTFSIFNNQQESLDFFSVLNNLHPALRFTAESEADNKLPFMDVLVHRSDNTFRRSVYRKPTFSGLYTRWDSFGPTQPKIALIKSLTSRAVRICSTSKLKDELTTLKELFSDNGYPSQVVEKAILEVMQKMSGRSECERIGQTVREVSASANRGGAEPPPPAEPPDPSDVVVDRDRVMLRLPWLGAVSNRYRKLATQAVTECFPLVKPLVLFTTRPAFSGRVKDVLPTTSRSNIIYQFTCSCGHTYVGRTSQRLSERMKQHLPDGLLKGRGRAAAAKQSDSAVTKHLKASSACISDELRTVGNTVGFKILAQARSQFHLNTLEALFIQLLAPQLCNQKDHVRVLSLF